MITIWNSCITVLPRGKQFFLFTCKWRPLLVDPRYYSVFQSMKRVYSYTLLTTNIPSLVSLRGRKKWNCTQWKRRRRKKRKLRREGWLLDGIAFIRAEAYLPRQTVLKVTNEGSCLLLRHESLNEEIIPQGPLITSTRNNGSGREKEEDRDKGFIEG